MMKQSTVVSVMMGVILAGYARSESLSSGRWVIFSESPASREEHGMVTGNGRHGARPMGFTDRERIIINHEEMFTRPFDRNLDVLPDIGHLLPKVREMIDAGQAGEAAAMAADEAKKQMKAKGMRYRKSVIPHVPFELFIDYANHETPSEYRRQLDLETGVVMTRWTVGNRTVEQKVFASRPHNAVIVQVKAVIGGKLSLGISLAQAPRKNTRLKEAGGFEVMKFSKPPVVTADKEWLHYDCAYGYDPGGYEGLLRVVAKGGATGLADKQIKVADASEVLIFIKADVKEDAKVDLRVGLQRALADMPADYTELLTPHAKEHGEMFRRATLDLGAAEEWKKVSTEKLIADSVQDGVSANMLEKMYAMGRYLLISTCGKYPSPLQGIWCIGWMAPWDGGFVLDSNVNLAISGGAMGNLHECAESYLNYIKGQLPGWRLNARRFLGCRGFLPANYSDPGKGHLHHFSAKYPHQYCVGLAGWNLHPVYDYALFTGDDELMKDEVLPLYLEMSDFYKDYMLKKEDGRYHIYPGYSPENRPRGKSPLCKDSSFDIAVAREVFRILIELGEQFDLDENKIAVWKDRHRNLVPYRINANGALAEWIDPKYGDNYRHRHVSHLIQTYPWWEFKCPDTDPKLIKAAQVALDRRAAFDARETHGQMHVALIGSRLKDVEKVKLVLHRLATRRYFYNSMITSCRNGPAISNLDAGLSLPRLLMEMLAFSRPGFSELMPCWPADYPDGTLSGLCIRGGHTMDLTWKNGKPLKAVIHAGKDDKGTIACGDLRKEYSFKSGRSYAFDAMLQ